MKDFLDKNDEVIKLVKQIRNAIEHPSKDKYLVIENFKLKEIKSNKIRKKGRKRMEIKKDGCALAPPMVPLKKFSSFFLALY